MIENMPPFWYNGILAIINVKNMCGIVGYAGDQKAVPILLEGLKRLEYRGYDSAGMAIHEGGKISVFRAVGRVNSLEEACLKRNCNATVGIAHTRWATHGKPCTKNSHPHSDCSCEISLVHNGIIENYRELKKQLEKKKHKFGSETDSEVMAHLIEELEKKLDFQSAFLETLKMIKGTYGLAVISKKHPGKLFVARMGSPLVLGIGKDENIVASDVAAIVRHTNRVIYLEDGEVAIVEKDNYEILNARNKKINKEIDT